MRARDVSDHCAGGLAHFEPDGAKRWLSTRAVGRLPSMSLSVRLWDRRRKQHAPLVWCSTAAPNGRRPSGSVQWRVLAPAGLALAVQGEVLAHHGLTAPALWLVGRPGQTFRSAFDHELGRRVSHN